MVFALRKPTLLWIAPVISLACVFSADAASLGQLHVNSALGAPLQVSVDLLGDDAGEVGVHCITTKIESADGRIPGIAQTSVHASDQGSSIQIRTLQNINEPILSLNIGVSCPSPFRRKYSILLDPAPARGESSAIRLSEVIGATDQSHQSADTTGSKRVLWDSGDMRPSRRKRRSSRTEADAISIAEANPAAAQVTRTKIHTASTGKSAERNLLRLDGAAEPGSTESTSERLKKTEILAVLDVPTDAEKAAEYRAIQQQFAASMREADPAQVQREKTEALREKMSTLSAEINRLKQRRAAYEAEMLRKQSEEAAFRMAIGIGGLLLVFLGILGWLGWRLYSLRKGAEQSLWGQGQTDIPDYFSGLPSLDEDTVPEDHDSEFDEPMRKGNVRNEASIAESDSKSDSICLPPADNTTIEVDYQVLGDDTIDPNVRRKAAKHRDDPQSLKAAQVLDVVQVAEFFLQHDNPAQAMETLESYAANGNPSSPVPWLYLLDLYRNTGSKEKYEVIAARTEQIFKTRIPGWLEQPFKGRIRKLPDFPHIVDHICEQWNSDDIVPYLESLLFNNRIGVRNGFALPVYQDVMQLIALANEPNPAKRREHIMFGKAYAIVFGREKNKGGNFRRGEKTEKEIPLPPIDTIEASPPAASVQEVPPGELNLPVLNEPEIDFAAPASKVPGRQPPKTTTGEISLENPVIEFVPPQMEPIEISVKEDKHDSQPVPEKIALAEESHESDMATKLQLALVYLEIGEKNGACTLLEEVIAGGSPEESEQARLTLSKVSDA